MRNRDMFYENYSAGGYNVPNMNMPMNQGIMPNNNCYMNNQMNGYGPNMVPEQMTGYSNNYDNNYEQRITKIEKQIRNLDTRVQKLESMALDNDNDDNIYMI